MGKIISLLILSIGLFLPTVSGIAQEGTPTPEVGILVRGFLANHTTGEPGPEGLELMLHAWDESGAARGMVHGVSGPDGVFELEGVIVEAGVFYAVMARYEGVAYFSEPVTVGEDGTLPNIEVAIYETTSDTTEIYLDVFQVGVGTGQGGLAIAELYMLSNRGNRTVVGSNDLGEGEGGPLMFSLPPDAANVSFPSASPERYRVFPGGFFDTGGLRPGDGTGHVLVNYILPYEEDSLTLIRPVPFDLGEVKVFIPHQLGLQVEISESMAEGVKVMSSSAEAFEVYSLGPLQQGDSVELIVTGTLPSQSPLASDQALTSVLRFDPGLYWVASILGVTLIISGLWWWRRTKDLEVEMSPGHEVEPLDEVENLLEEVQRG